MLRNNYSIVIPSYTVGTEAYSHIQEFCAECGTKAVVIGGHKAMAAARTKLEASTSEGPVTITDFVHYGDEASYECAKVLEDTPSVRDADMIFAVGGGKAVDTAKLVAIHLGKPFFTFPTIASNCAAASSVAIIYNPDGTFREFVHYVHTARHIFIDTQIIAEAPPEYMWAGIGDTYAKYYEVSISTRGEELPHYMSTGVHLSQLCMEPLLKYGSKALEDNRSDIASDELSECALTIIITTGWVSMLVARNHNMDYNGGVAHAMFYALCRLPGFEQNNLHGAAVGFGVLLQLLIDGDTAECERLRAFNKSIGLPTSLKEIGVTLDDLASVATHIIDDEDVRHFPYQLTKDKIIEAARALQ